MEDTFKYLSPLEFERLGQTEKDRYLAALNRHLHGGYFGGSSAGDEVDPLAASVVSSSRDKFAQE